MNKKNEIEQHPLLNEKGDHVKFLLDDWGELHDYSYDYLKAHRHDFYEILVFERGSAKHDIDFTSYTAKGGNIHFVAPDNVHLLLREKNSKGFSIQFNNGFFPIELIEKLPFNAIQPTLKIPRTEFKKISYLTSQIRIEVNDKHQLSESIIYSYFNSLLLLLIRNSNLYSAKQTNTNHSPYIDSFRRLIREHYKQHCTVEHYASLLNISSKHLIEVCKEHTGKTPLKIIQEIVISEAKRHLFHTDNSIKEIAYSLGFDDPANFSKYFKAASGFSPLAYRLESGK